MSVATEFAPIVFIPQPARTPRPSATVLTLRPPSAASIAPLLRLTRRGVLVLSLAVAALAGGLVWLAALSAPAAGPAGAAVPASVTVQSGDTLWSIATVVAPNRDPRSEVADLQHLNHLSGVSLTPGQTLRTR
ncbi:MAG: LysM peptidoglycan-binding domain-containing protein [Jatrophihabitantaceae bacterium]